LYDWEIVEQIAKDAHVSEQVVATLDGKLRSELETGWPLLPEIRVFLASVHAVSQKSPFHRCHHGNAVILGRVQTSCFRRKRERSVFAW